MFAPVLAVDPSREALVTCSGRWTYGELDEMAARAAGVLREMGVRPGDRVAACLPNDVDIIAAFHGAMRLGAIWVGINQALAAPEREYLMADSGASLLLDDADEWRTAMAGATPVRDLPPVDPFAAAGLAYTSGTTGRPKGVIHSQHNLLVPGAVLVRSRGYDASLRKGDCLPLTILNMLVLTTLLVAQSGGTAVIIDTMYAEGVADWIEREQVTVWNGPPPLLHTMAYSEGVRPEALASLREAWSGGADLPPALRAAFGRKFRVPVVGTYGLSEAPTVVSIDPPSGEHVEGASGRVLPHLHVETVADELCVSATTSGEFAGLYRPPLGYWNRPEESAAAFAGGVVRTGDIGEVDSSGWLHVRDRKKLVIVRGGANVYPAEVERVLQAIDGVAGSAVTGMPDERLGERVVAAVQLAPGASLDAAEIIARCTSELAKYKVPERILFVETLPRNAMGKVDRVAVRELFAR